MIRTGILILISIQLTPLLRLCDLAILNRDNRPVTIRIELAETDVERTKGLMHRKKLDRNSGMLFVFEDERPRSFWMKDTHIPLSIAYISGEGIINEIYDMKPLDISVTYPSILPARYALEVNQGWFRTNRIKPGCRISLNGCISQ